MRIGIDLGGTKVAAVVLSGERVLAQRRRPTPANDYQGTLRLLVQLVKELEQELGAQVLPVGLGHPGSVTPGSGLIRNANSTCLNGRPLQRDLEAQLGRPVAMANDANCMALSELHDGAARGLESAFLVILGTGVGGAVVNQGRLHCGANGLAGEWGHNPLPWMSAAEFPGELCWCGQRGCLETWLSGPALSRCHAAAGGGTLSAREIAVAAHDGHPQARASMAAYAQRLARALAAVINCLDPQCIVLAGGLSQIEYLYHAVPGYWGQWVFAEQVNTRLVPARHGDASGVRGAARLE